MQKNKRLLFILFMFIYSNGFALYFGDGTNTDSEMPVFIMSEIEDVYCSKENTLFLKKDYSLWGCGRNGEGELGTEKKEECLAPVKIAENVISFCTSYNTVMYVTNDNDLFLIGEIPVDIDKWGYVTYQTTQEPLLYKKNILKCFCIDNSFFYLTKSNDLYSFGNNLYGRLSDGTEKSRIKPQKILSNVVDINGKFKLNALTKNGDVYRLNETPELIANNILKIKGDYLIDINNKLYVLGSNLYGSLGLGKGISHKGYTFIMDDIIDMDGTEDHSLFVTKNNEIYVSGGGNKYNFIQATGDGKEHYTPFKLDINNVIKVRVSDHISFIIKEDNTLWACGVNSFDSLNTY